MPTEPESDAKPGAGDSARAISADYAARLPFPPRARRFRARSLKGLRQTLRPIERRRQRMVERLAATPATRTRTAIIGAVALNFAILAVLAIYGRVTIFVPNKPATSISVVFVDVQADVPTIDLRDPELAPEPEPQPEPEPVIEPEITPEPEPAPAPEPEVAPEPEFEPETEPEPEPEPVIDMTPEPVFAPPSEVEEEPFIPETPAPAVEEPAPGDIVVEGEQSPAEEAPPLVTAEPVRPGEAQTDGADADDESEEGGADFAAGEIDAPALEADIKPAPPPDAPAGDDMFDEAPVFGSRLALPPVDLPRGETSAVPGTSGVVAIFCPEEFTDKEKIAECAGRPEIRSGWRPGSSGEDFSRAAAVLKGRRQHGDFSNDAVTFGPELARQANERAKIEDLEEFRREQDLGDAGVAKDPASGTRPDLAPPIEPSWTRRDDPLVDQKDVERLKRELEEAEKNKSPE